MLHWYPVNRNITNINNILWGIVNLHVSKYSANQYIYVFVLCYIGITKLPSPSGSLPKVSTTTIFHYVSILSQLCSIKGRYVNISYLGSCSNTKLKFQYLVSMNFKYVPQISQFVRIANMNSIKLQFHIYIYTLNPNKTIYSISQVFPKVTIL